MEISSQPHSAIGHLKLHSDISHHNLEKVMNGNILPTSLGHWPSQILEKIMNGSHISSQPHLAIGHLKLEKIMNGSHISSQPHSAIGHLKLEKVMNGSHISSQPHSAIGHHKLEKIITHILPTSVGHWPSQT